MPPQFYYLSNAPAQRSTWEGRGHKRKFYYVDRWYINLTHNPEVMPDDSLIAIFPAREHAYEYARWLGITFKEVYE